MDDFRLKDGSSVFLTLKEIVSTAELLTVLKTLNHVLITETVDIQATEIWIDFDYMGKSFSVNSQCGEYRFIRNNLDTDESIVKQIIDCFTAPESTSIKS